jgi:hypothetical protein
VKLEIPPPFFGRSDKLAYVSQQPGTTETAKNVRGIDPVTGRQRIAQRAGLTKLVSAKIDGATSAPVKHAASITFDNKRKSYAATGPAQTSNDLEWRKVPPGRNHSPEGAIDSQGNVYAIVSQTYLVKYNSEGELVWNISVPTRDPQHVLRALAIDGVGGIYVGVSEGGAQRQSRIWKYREQEDDGTPQVEWTIDTELYVEAMKVTLGSLYTVQNDVEQWRSAIVVYSGINATGVFVPNVEPYIATITDQVAYPVVNFDVGEEGQIYVASPPNPNRGKHPRASQFTPSSISWSPRDSARWNSNAWCWLDAWAVLSEDGAEMDMWLDQSGNGRHMRKTPGKKGPTWIKRGVGYRPSVRFNGIDTQLRSDVALGGGGGAFDSHRTLWPGTTGMSWTMLIVMRPYLPSSAEPAAAAGQCVVSQFDNISGAFADQQFLGVNRDNNGANTLGTVARGKVSWYEESTTANTPPANMAAGNNFDTSPSVCIVAITQNLAGGSPTANVRLNGAATAMTWVPTQHAAFARTILGDHFQNTADLDPFKGDILEIIVLGDPSADFSTFYSAGGDGLRLEGYLAHKHGIAHLLPGTHPYAATPPLRPGAAGTPPELLITSTYGILAKYGAVNAELLWAATTWQNVPVGGVGHGVRASRNNAVYSTGPRVTATFGGLPYYDHVGVRRIIDKGDSYSIADGDGAWVNTMPLNLPYTPYTPVPGSYDLTYPNTRLDVDEFGNLYQPFFKDDGASVGLQYFVHAERGQPNGGGYNMSRLIAYGQGGNLFPDDQQVMAIRVDPSTPPYVIGDATTPLPLDFKTSPVSVTEYARARFIVCFSRASVGVAAASAPPVESIHKIELVSVTATTGSHRAVTNLAIAAGQLKRWEAPGTVTAPAGTGTLTGVLFNPDARIISSDNLLGKWYATDGLRYFVYDPKTDVLSYWKPSSAGKIPPNMELLVRWRSRIVLARGENPALWHMSRQGKPNDHNVLPAIPDKQQAISSVSALAGDSPDIVNALMPLNDDHLLFGCDSSIWRLTGDPADNGVFDRVSDKTGVAYGRAWTTDTKGRVWFWGSRGGLYVMTVGSMPERVSLHTIDVEMAKVDLSAYRVELVWNTDVRMEGLHVLVVPYGSGGVPVRHFFWEEKTNGQWEDTFGKTGSTNVQPTCFVVVDGDEPNDRAILWGCEDSYLRKLDVEAADDDGTAIDSEVVYGPLRMPSMGDEIRVTGLQAILADGQGEVGWELYAAETADDKGSRVATGTWRPGLSLASGDTASGGFVWVRLKSAKPGNRWAIERLMAEFYPAGREVRYT